MYTESNSKMSRLYVLFICTIAIHFISAGVFQCALSFIRISNRKPKLGNPAGMPEVNSTSSTTMTYCANQKSVNTLIQRLDFPLPKIGLFFLYFISYFSKPFLQKQSGLIMLKINKSVHGFLTRTAVTRWLLRYQQTSGCRPKCLLLKSFCGFGANNQYKQSLTARCGPFSISCHLWISF